MRAASLRARLTVWYTVALLIVMALGGAVVLWQAGTHRPSHAVDRQLPRLNATLANLMKDELTEDPVLATAALRRSGDDHRPGRAVAILDQSGIGCRRMERTHSVASIAAFDDGGACGQPNERPVPGGCAPEPTQVEQQSLVHLDAAPLAESSASVSEVRKPCGSAFPSSLRVARSAVVARVARFAADHEDGGTGRTDAA
jgi:hypothetical protein